MGKTKLIIRKSYLNSKGEANIFVRYSHKDKTVDFATGERIPPQYWDAVNQRVRKSYPRYTGINNYIEQKRNEIDNVRLDLKTRKIEPTTEVLRQEYKREPETKQPISEYVFDHWKDFVTYKRSVTRLSKSTLSQYEVSKRVFEDFEKHIGTRMTMDMVTQAMIDDFTQYCYDVKEYVPNTLGSRVKHIKSLFEFLVDRNITTNTAYRKFKKPSNETSIVTLTIQELDHLFHLDLTSDPRLERTRDIFLLGCASGLRFSDYSVLVSANLKDDYIIISTEKMDNQVRIPLNDYSRGIISKYPNGLPTLSNSNFNKYIKEVGIRAQFFEDHEVVSFKRGIKVKYFKPLYQLLTSHTARRTFATQSLERKMDIHIVMAITGHRDYRSFARYINVSQIKLKQAMNDAWNTLSK